MTRKPRSVYRERGLVPCDEAHGAACDDSARPRSFEMRRDGTTGRPPTHTVNSERAYAATRHVGRHRSPSMKTSDERAHNHWGRSGGLEVRRRPTAIRVRTARAADMWVDRMSRRNSCEFHDAWPSWNNRYNAKSACRLIGASVMEGIFAVVVTAGEAMASCSASAVAAQVCAISAGSSFSLMP